MADAPAGSRLLSDTEIGDSWVDTRNLWTQSTFPAIACILIGCVALLFDSLKMNAFLGLVAVSGLFGLFGTLVRISKKRSELDVIAISTGHPWHDSESTGKTSVYVLSEGDEWVRLEPETRLVQTIDPLLGKALLRRDDADGEIIVRWAQTVDERIIAMINMAQALANAQDRDPDSIDDFEAAREREDTAEGILDREWMDTEIGSTGYEPGAILRAFKRGKDDERKNDE